MVGARVLRSTVVCFIALVGITLGCNRVSTPGNRKGLATIEQPQVSIKSGLVLKVVESPAEPEGRSFVICTPEGDVLFECPDAFSTRHTLFICWDEHDRVWVYSGDIGVFYWEQSDEGIWEQRVYRRGALAPPKVLKELRPNIFP